jgi:predicted MFS family arabinose efflux permease
VRDPESLANRRLLVAFLVMLLVSGIGNAFPVFFPPLLAEFGGSRAATASTVTLMWLTGAALAPVAGVLLVRWGPRRVVAIGLAAVAAGLAIGATARTLAVFTLAVGLGSGVGVGLTGMVTQAAVIADTYVRRRGFATGIAFSGSMAGYALGAPLQLAISHLGWRSTLAFYVGAMLVLLPVAFAAYPARLGAVTAAVDERRVLHTVRSPAFAMLAVVFFVPPLVGYLATVQHTLYLTARGFSAEQAALFLLVGGVLSAAGRALAGLVSDRIGAPATGLVSYSVSLAGMLCLLAMEIRPATVFVYGYVLLVFLPLGSRATIVAILVTRIASPRRYALVYGLLSLGNSLGAGAGPLLSGLLYDRTGSYLIIFAVATALLGLGLLSLVAFLRLTRQPAWS